MKYIILAAGSGTRLWPLSRNSLPKQFLHFGDEESLLQKTVKRFYPQVPPQDILIVTHQSYFHLVKNQLTSIHPDFANSILLEPEKKSTAPAICLAIKYFQEILKVDAEECFLVCSSDHIISPESVFLSAILEATQHAKQGHHILFGIRPHKPETGYGYIKTAAVYEGKTLRVDAFVEKPDSVTAKSFLLSGQYLWNSGIFLFHGPTFFKELNQLCPEIGALCAGTFGDLHAHFSQMPTLSIDYALMEKSQQILVMPLDVSWSDIGSWDSVYDLLEKDQNQNVKVGNIVDLNCNHCLIMGNKRLISTVGLDNLIIIETEDALFIGKKGDSQQVKALVDQLKKINARESLEHLTSHRPWGSFTILEEGPRYKIKRIVVEPQQRLSLQLHYHRSEHWVVVKGTAKITLDDKEQLLHENESIYVEKSQVHRLENPGKVPLELIEVQVGEYVGEDDIVRLEDIYQRTTGKQ